MWVHRQEPNNHRWKFTVSKSPEPDKPRHQDLTTMEFWELSRKNQRVKKYYLFSCFEAHSFLVGGLDSQNSTTEHFKWQDYYPESKGIIGRKMVIFLEKVKDELN